jgi:hypothetical protein
LFDIDTWISTLRHVGVFCIYKKPHKEFWLSVLTENRLSGYTALGLTNTSPNICFLKGAAGAMSEERVAPSQRQSKGKPPATAADTETLNFKVASAFKKEFKGYAVSQGITMVELLKEGFELSKRKRKP